MEGVVSTRVGYAGGTSKNPTYANLGDHTETIDIVFDPRRITYEELLRVFWESHDPRAPSLSRQYASFIFFHTNEQKTLALKTKEEVESRGGRKVSTHVVPAGIFYPAEDYHQKYYLRRYEGVVRELEVLHQGQGDYVTSTAAARINGYLGGNGSLERLTQQLRTIGLSAETTERVTKAVRGAMR